MNLAQPKRFTRHARSATSLKSGGGGGSIRTHYEKIRRFVQKSFFSPVEYGDLESAMGGG